MPPLRLVPMGLKLVVSAVLAHETNPLLVKLMRTLKLIRNAEYFNFITNGDLYSQGSTLVRQSLKKRMPFDQLLQRENPKTRLDEKQRCQTCVLQEIKCKDEDLI